MSYRIDNCSAFDLIPSLKKQVDLIVTSPPYNIGSKAPRNDPEEGRKASMGTESPMVESPDMLIRLTKGIIRLTRFAFST